MDLCCPWLLILSVCQLTTAFLKRERGNVLNVVNNIFFCLAGSTPRDELSRFQAAL